MSEVHDALIIGAGFSGLGMAIQLNRRGYDDLVIIDREQGAGGTWHVNRYPGLTVDVASLVYSFSFEPYPGWTRLFAPQSELKAYANHVVNRYGLDRYLRFGLTAVSASWNADSHSWSVIFDDGTQLRGRLLFLATGFLSQPKVPDIAGIEAFEGQIMHTARWPADADLDGRRVAVIGTGATGVQLIPEIADRAAALTVFQRTAIWVSPKIDGPIPRPVRAAFRRWPLLQAQARKAAAAFYEWFYQGAFVSYTRANGRANRVQWLAEKASLFHLRRQVPGDPELRSKLTPTYPLGCRRPTVSNRYFKTFARPNCSLVTEGIEAVGAREIRTVDGAVWPIDTLVLATGFDLWDTNFPAIRVSGVDGCDLATRWREERFGSYEGVTVPGFPNLVLNACPQSSVGASYFLTIETQMTHVDRLLGALQAADASSFEVTEAAYADYDERFRAGMENSLYVNGHCSLSRSYYFDPHGVASHGRPTASAEAQRIAASFPISDYAFA